MRHEMDSLEKNHTWDLVPRLIRKNVVKFRWVYRKKITADSVAERHKDHLVVKGFSQQEGINYTETIASIAKMNLVQLILSLVARFGWETHQIDVKSAFFHGELFEEIYMEKPHGLMTYSNLVYQLKKSLYGLK